MVFTSQIGDPFYCYSLEKQEWKKNEKLEGFTIPFNLFDNVHGLFRRFNLWQSSNGICKTGILHKPFQRGKSFAINTTPILVGDMLLYNDKEVSITYCNNESMPERNMWMCLFELGHMPEPMIPQNPMAISLLENLINTDTHIVDFVCKFFESFLNEILPACNVLTQLGSQPILPNFAIAKLESLKIQMKQDINQILEKTKESLWY